MTRRLREVVLWAGAALGLVALALGVAVTFFGFSLLVFRSGSMSPSIPTGALALARTVPAADLAPGDVASVVASGGERVTHRVVSTTVRGDQASLVLQGDANAVEDAEVYQVTTAERVVASAPYAGFVLAHALTPPGLVAVGSLALVLLLLGFGPAPGEPRRPRASRASRRPGRHVGPRRRPRSTRVAAGAVVGAVLLGGPAAGLVVGPGRPAAVAGTWARFTDSATSQTGSFDASRFFTCSAATTGVGSPYLYWRFDETIQGLLGSTAADSSGNGRSGQYQAAVLTSLGLGQERACPRDTGTAVQLNGTDQYVATTSTTAVVAPNTFSTAIRFKTTTAGGQVLGFGGSRTGTSTNYDRMIYMTSAGQLVFGVFPGSLQTVRSGTGLADGRWHQVVATLGPAGMHLYVDGTEVGTPLPGITTGQSFSGFWRVGFDNLNTWPDRTTNTYFGGTVDDFAVYGTQLDAAAVLDLWRAGRRP